ncbi:glycosyltransferase [Propionicicella superfundia]|uniref:glycosyltransferase n=1 Tax=Propionicicella superfundia TaxID=348582 RepID=UPI0003F9F8D6|nr:glycosyltransferase [Propionicicella superfundia]
MTGVIVHEWIEPLGGAERVADRISGLYPDAPIVTLWNDAPERFAAGRVAESWLARTPLRHHKALALPLMPATWRHLGRSDASWVLAFSHLFSHHVRFSGPARGARKLVYCYTPARYIWNPESDVRGQGVAQRIASPGLRVLDRARAQEADSIAVVSHFVRERVERYWHRDAVVINPPVAVASFARHGGLTAAEEDVLAALPDTFLLGASRFVAYKRLDLVIAAGRAADVPVVLAGDGPERAHLEELAAGHPGLVHFVPRPSDALLRALYQACLAYVFPPVEDFGIMPLEAMAAGAPVIARRQGGAAETVLDKVTGALVDDFSGAEVREALERAGTAAPAALAARAAEFDETVFDARIRAWLGPDA